MIKSEMMTLKNKAKKKSRFMDILKGHLNLQSLEQQ